MIKIREFGKPRRMTSMFGAHSLTGPCTSVYRGWCCNRESGHADKHESGTAMDRKYAEWTDK